MNNVSNSIRFLVARREGKHHPKEERREGSIHERDHPKERERAAPHKGDGGRQHDLN